MQSWQPGRFTPAQLEERRATAARYFRSDKKTGQAVSQAAIARALGVSRAAVS